MATIRDVANKAGVSMATVSRVLNGDFTISVPPDTRDRVFQAARDLHYLSRKRPRGGDAAGRLKVGMVLFLEEQQEPVRPYYQSVRLGVERELEVHGIGVSVIRGDAHLNFMRGLDGFIIIGQNIPETVYGGVEKGRVVFVDDSPEPSQYNSVIMDFPMSVALAMRHLFELGHTDIGFIGGAGNPREERLRAYRAMMEERGFYNPDRVFLRDWWPEDGYAAMKEAIDKGDLPTAFFVASDPLAIGSLSALHERCIHVPRDVSIVSFDDVPTAAYLNPPLTTVRAYPELMGRLAVGLFLESFRGRHVPLKITVPPALIVRETTGRPDRASRR